MIPVDAHVRLASAAVNDGERILRRGYSFTDGVDESLGELEAGLFFIAFQRDPEKQFVAIQRRLGSNDALNEYIKHVGSAVFAVPPGAAPGRLRRRNACSAETRRTYSDSIRRFLLGSPNSRPETIPTRSLHTDEPTSRPRRADRRSPLGLLARLRRRLRLQRRRARPAPRRWPSS